MQCCIYKHWPDPALLGFIMVAASCAFRPKGLNHWFWLPLAVLTSQWHFRSQRGLLESHTGGSSPHAAWFAFPLSKWTQQFMWQPIGPIESNYLIFMWVIILPSKGCLQTGTQGYELILCSVCVVKHDKQIWAIGNSSDTIKVRVQSIAVAWYRPAGQRATQIPSWFWNTFQNSTIKCPQTYNAIWEKSELTESEFCDFQVRFCTLTLG